MTNGGIAVREARQPVYSRIETLTAVVVVGLLGLMLGLFALVRPAEVFDERSYDYTHSGTFGYAAEPRGTSPYGPDGVSPGEPIFTELLGPVTTSFAYELKSKAPASVRGSATLLAEVELSEGLSREFVIADEREFSGSKTDVSGRLPVRAIRQYVEAAYASMGDSGLSSATVILRPVIELDGTLGGHELDSRFSPELAFSLEGSSLTPVLGEGPVASRDASATGGLEPSEDGKVDYEVLETNTVPLVFADLSVPQARAIGFTIFGLCLVVALWISRPFLRSGDAQNEHRRIRTLYGSHIIEVSVLERHHGSVAYVGSIDALVDLAKKYESMIMHVTGPDGDSYSVWDNGLLYEYRPRGGDEMDEPHGKHSDVPTLNGSVPVANGSQKSPHKARN